MNRVRMSRGKFEGISALANEQGVIAALAIDQRGSLGKMIAKGRDNSRETPDAELTEFKTIVTRELTPYATGLLMDPEYGLPAVGAKDPSTGVLLAYEKSGYDATDLNRLPDLLPEWSVRRLVAAGANAIKILLYYNPFDIEEVNTIKHALMERIGDECIANDVPFFLEPIVYNNEIGDAKGLEFAQRKPELVTASIAELTKPQYGVDVLKVEVPVNMAFVEGTSTFKGQAAYSRDEAMQLFRDSAAAATKPFIYLSAGVTNEQFLETLELAAEAGTAFSGVLCGRATWQDGVPAYSQQGVEGLEAWLRDQGARNIQALNAVLAKGAQPWWTVYGGQENIEVA